VTGARATLVRSRMHPVSRLVLAVVLAGVPFVPVHADEAVADDGASVPGFTRMATETCTVGGRTIELRAWERLEAEERAATWMLEACIVQDDLPTTCLATMTPSEPLPPGMSSSGRAFLARCAPAGRAAWVLDVKWTEEGLQARAWKLDLTALVDATVSVDENGLKDVRLAPDRPLLPEEPHPWTARDPRPLPECIPLAMDARALDDGLVATIRPASTSCTGWTITYEGARGSFHAAPMAGYAAPDLRAEAPTGPLTVSPGRPLGPEAPENGADEPSAAPETPAQGSRNGRGQRGSLLSFSRR
jgi:hypothetical protein